MAGVLLLGATGLLGQAIVRELHARGYPVKTAARRGAQLCLDIADGEALQQVLDRERPKMVINCAALVDVAACRADPNAAYRINAAPLVPLANWSKANEARLIHVSTDHFYMDGGARPHDEAEPVTLVNEYAATKYAGECFALLAPQCLVLRTSIIGMRGWEQPTFAEWALDAVQRDSAMTLFADAFTSSIDVRTFARAALDLATGSTTGLLNLAAATVYSKEAFVRTLAQELGLTLTQAISGSVKGLSPVRPASLGLDVSRAQALLPWALPDLSGVVRAIVDEHRSRGFSGL